MKETKKSSKRKKNPASAKNLLITLNPINIINIKVSINIISAAKLTENPI